ncbi:GAF domain-containing protein [Nitriliruptoraceae bacterium ZYF776]|nr:GAF domain-containing protein [Profundirhabdus halotolerans]
MAIDALELDEPRRVGLLRAEALLDTPAEDRFDRITRTASRLLGFPIVLINLVDDTRQWAKSAVGFAHGAEAPRADSFCARAVDQRAPLLVPETRHDPRFVDNPMVTAEPHLRSYFGYPVRGPQGAVFGTLCLADRVPRQLDDEQLGELEDLAGWVEAELDRGTLATVSLLERRDRERIEAVAAAVPDAIVVADRDGLISLANPAAETLAQVGRGELEGRRLDEVLGDAAAYAQLEPLLDVGPDLEPRRGRVAVARRDATVRELDVAITRLPGRSVSVVVARDVSEQVALERLKDEFVSTVSHELRTPMTSIKGTLSLVVAGVAGEVSAEACSLLRVAHDNTDRLVRLVNDILDLERLSSGRVELELDRCEVRRLVELAVGNVKGLAEEAEVVFELDIAPLTVLGDEDRLVQVVTNLLGNAVKFSPAGGRVEVRARELDGRLRVDVRDHGRGVPPDLADHIFDRFGQVDASDSKVRGGSGLGLPIARGLVERHDGRLWVESVPGEGATFCFELPLTGPGAEAAGEGTAAASDA